MGRGRGAVFVILETLINFQDCESNVERLERRKKIVVRVAKERDYCWEEEEGWDCWEEEEGQEEERGSCVRPSSTVSFNFF